MRTVTDAYMCLLHNTAKLSSARINSLTVKVFLGRSPGILLYADRRWDPMLIHIMDRGPLAMAGPNGRLGLMHKPRRTSR